MRKVAASLLVSLTALLLAIGMLAAPAFAAEDPGDHAEDAGEHADEADEASGFGTGEWDGLILAAIGAVFVGGFVFASSGPGEIGKSDDHH